MEFIPYCAKEAFQFCFYQIPKELFTNEYYKGKLSSDAIILYGLLLDRLSVSIKNKWIDENGLIYLILTRKEAMEKLNISDKTATKAFRQLKELKLISERRMGKGKTYKIYVGKINRKKYEIVKIIIVIIKIVRRLNQTLNNENMMIYLIYMQTIIGVE